MKIWLATLAMMIGCSTLQAQPTLAPGNDVSLEAVRKAQWIQGRAPAAFEPGKVYIFECWATWCGPCVASIPHLNQLHETYRDKGLVIHGMNVWEDNAANVKTFVKNKGKGMTYPVAFTGGHGSPFDKLWLQPAGVRGIPHAFVVINGKLVQSMHPAQLNEATIEQFLDDAKKSMPKPPPAVKSINELIKDYQLAVNMGNAEEILSLIKEIETLDPKFKDLPGMRMDWLVAKQDWPSAGEAIEVMADSPGGLAFLQKLTTRVVMDESRTYPAEWLKMLAAAYSNNKKDQGLTALDHVGIAMLYWRASDKETARAQAKLAATAAEKESAKDNNPQIKEYYAKFSTAADAGTMTTMKAFQAGLPH